MDGRLVQVFCPSDSFTESIDLVVLPHQVWDELCARLQRLERDNLEFRQQLDRANLEFRQQVGFWKSRHRDALLRNAALEQENHQLKGEKRQLQADLFGRRSETKPLKDRSNHLDDPQADSQHPKRKRGQQPENHGPQRRDYSQLPVREKPVEIPPEQCVCPDCGQPLRLRSDTEDSEQIEIEVHAYRLKLQRRRYERTCTCEGNRTLTAPPPPKLINNVRLSKCYRAKIVYVKG